MFHTYVSRMAEGKVDFDRAAFLMDKALLNAAIEARDSEKERNPQVNADHDAQWVWDTYCKLHLEKYGVPFEPHINPDWG